MTHHQTKLTHYQKTVLLGGPTPFDYHSGRMEIDLLPARLLKRLGVSERNLRHVSLLVSSALIVLFLPVVIHIPHLCLFRTLLGVPCPGCGVMHAMVASFKLNFAAAWRANPAGIGIALVTGFQIGARPFALAVPRTGPSITVISVHLSQFVLASLMVVWITRLV